MSVTPPRTLPPLTPAGPVMADHGPLAAVVDSLDDGLIITAWDGRIVFHNPAAARVLGVPGTRLVGASLPDILVRLGVRAAPADRRTSLHVAVTIGDRKRTLRLRAFRISDENGAVGVGHLVEDVTATRRVILRHRGLELDTETMQASLHGRRLDLTRTEAALLRLFMENAGTTVSHARVLRQVWGPKYRDEAHYVRVYVNRLRQKIETDPAHPAYLVTDHGVGYRFAG